MSEAGRSFQISPRLPQRLRIRIRQRAFLHCFRCFFHIIFKPDELNADAVFVQNGTALVHRKQGVAAPWVAVLGLAHRADIDGMAVVRRFFRAGIEGSVVGLVRMPKAEDVGVSAFEDAQQAFFFPVLKQVLVDFAGAAVHQQQVQLVVVQLKFQTDMGGQRAQILALRWLCDLVGKRNGHCPVGLLVVGLVGTAAVVNAPANTKVIVPGDGRDAPAAYFPDDFVGPDIVADEVAEAINGVGLAALDVGETGFEGGQIGVDVGE